jgi:hypothetical protein
MRIMIKGGVWKNTEVSSPRRSYALGPCCRHTVSVWTPEAWELKLDFANAV